MAEDLEGFFSKHGRVDELELDDQFRKHLAERSFFGKHAVSLTEILQVHANVPKYYMNGDSRPGRAPLVMVGPTFEGRILCVPVEPTENHGVWRPKTAFEANTHHINRYLEKR